MESKQYDTDKLILHVYQKVYEKSDLDVEQIDYSKIVLDRFKFTDYNLDDIFSKTPIQYLGEFPTGIESKEHRWKRQGEFRSTTIRIIPYSDKLELTSITNPVNVHQIIKTLLSELVTSEKTLNLILPIINVDVTGKDLMEYEKVKNYINPHQIYSVQLTEKFYSMRTLEQFFKDYPTTPQTLFSIIHQLVDTFYHIIITYPKFRNNQLFPHLIDCYLMSKDNQIIPQIKISNHYLSKIDLFVENKQISMVDTAINNVYADLYQMFNYMWNHMQTVIKQSSLLGQIFDHILPPSIRSDGTHLSVDKWNQLSEDVQFQLSPKNLRNYLNQVDGMKPYPTNVSYYDTTNINEDGIFAKYKRNHDEYSDTEISSENEKRKKYTMDKDMSKNRRQRKEEIYRPSQKDKSDSDDFRQKSEKFKRSSDNFKISEGILEQKNERIKTYRGSRNINNYQFNDFNNGNSLRIEKPVIQEQGQGQYINSIGQLFGKGVNDYQSMPPYQPSQPYLVPETGANFNPLMTNYQPAAVPSSDNDAMYRYLSAYQSTQQPSDQNNIAQMLGQMGNQQMIPQNNTPMILPQSQLTVPQLNQASSVYQNMPVQTGGNNPGFFFQQPIN